MKKVMQTQGTCLQCKKVFAGRSDKKFCNALCRSELHNRIARAKKRSISLLRILKVPLPEFESPKTIPPSEPSNSMFLKHIIIKLPSETK